MRILRTVVGFGVTALVGCARSGVFADDLGTEPDRPTPVIVWHRRSVVAFRGPGPSLRVHPVL